MYQKESSLKPTLSKALQVMLYVKADVPGKLELGPQSKGQGEETPKCGFTR